MTKLYTIRNTSRGPLQDCYVTGKPGTMWYTRRPEKYPSKEAFRVWLYLKSGTISSQQHHWLMEVADE